MAFWLPQLLADSADRFPDRIALRFSNQSMSYKELAERSDDLARALVACGVRHGDCIGVYLNKRLESLISIFGVLKAGAVYVPLDPFSPVARLVTIILDCSIQ